MINFIILGAGKGTRMKSNIPKVLHSIASYPLIEIVISLTKQFVNSKVVVVSSSENDEEIKKFEVETVIQEERLGTGHAVLQALPFISSQNQSKTFILYGDTPLIKAETLKKMEEQEADIVVLGFEGDVKERYGRLVARGQKVERIVEFKDLREEEKGITLFNSGVFLVKSSVLKDLVPKISNQNKAGEYYLTDLIELANKNNLTAKFILCEEEEVMGVNTREDLAKCELIMQNRLRNIHLSNGVTMLDKNSVFFSLDTKIEQDSTIEPNVFFGRGVSIKTGCTIKAFSYLEGCEVASNVSIGPFARVRGKTQIDEDCKIGNFVEIKNSHLANGVKAGHLSYIGDGEIGENVNIGAGTVLCNYDGVKKHKTVIQKNVFIGSNSSLVAPLTVEENAKIGAGSVITKTVPKNSLAIERSKQLIIENYKKP